MEKVYFNSKFAKIFLCLSSCHTIMWFGNIYSKRSNLSEYSINHELIHCRQFKEHTILACIIAVCTIIMSALISWSWYALISIPIAICFYYILYCLEYILDFVVQLFHCFIHPKEFKNLFNNTYRYCLLYEQEAYDNQYNLHYLETRKKFSCYKYFGKLIYCKKEK